MCYNKSSWIYAANLCRINIMMSNFPLRSLYLRAVCAAILLAFPLLARPDTAGAAVRERITPGAYVNDYAGAVDPAAAGKLNGVLAELDAKAKAQVAVAVIDSLGGADIETYSVDLYKKWGIGDKQTNRGVLVLVAIQDRKARIEVGYGLEGILPDGLTGSVQDKYMIPYFKKGNYSEGIYEGTLALCAIIAKDRGVELSAEPVTDAPEQMPPLSGGQKVFFLILAVFLIILFIRHPFLFFLLLNSGRSGSFGGGGFGGGGFGGFGGGMSGGGGSSRSW